MPERARHAVYGSEGVAAVQRIRRLYESVRVISVSMGQGLGLAAFSEARASACVSIYSRMFVSLPFRTVMAKDPMVLKRLIRGFDSPRSEADDQNPVSLRYELGGLWEGSFHRFVSLLK